MQFALARSVVEKLVADLERVGQSPQDAQLREQCITQTNAVCDSLACGSKLKVQLHKVIYGDKRGRAAKLLSVVAEGGAWDRRLKFTKMF